MLTVSDAIKQRQEEENRRFDAVEQFHLDRFAGAVDDNQMDGPDRVLNQYMFSDSPVEDTLGSILSVTERRLQTQQDEREELSTASDLDVDDFRGDQVLKQLAKADVDFMADFNAAMNQGDQQLGLNVSDQLISFAGNGADALRDAQELRVRSWAYQDLSYQASDTKES